MSSDSDAIRRVVEAFEKSTWSEIDVRVGSVRVHLRAGESTDPGLGHVSAQRVEPDARPELETLSRVPANPASVAPSSPLTAADLAADAFVVRSPSPGIFWRSPQPGAPPFADVGHAVDTASTLCIVEVMKLMNHVKSGVAGTIVAVFGRDGVAVEKDEPLFAIHTGSAP